jgi:hypothetical protein
MQRPRKPGRKASNADWDRYHNEEYQWKMWKQQQHRGPQHVQHRDEDVVVKVRSDYSRNYDSLTTDVQVYPRDGTGDHIHHVLDEYGNVIHDAWTER